MKLKTPVATVARELLGDIWNYKVKPSWWRWWLASPLYCWRKRILFTVLFVLILALLLFHLFMPTRFPSPEANLNLYIFLIVLLIGILASPSIARIKARDFEVELRSPPPFEPVLSPLMMEGSIRDLEYIQGVEWLSQEEENIKGPPSQENE